MVGEGKYTVETFARERNLSRQSAINLLSKMKKKGLVQVKGGGRQKRIYRITKTTQRPTNGFFDIVNKYSPIKLNPLFKHYTYGKYTVEHAIIDGLKMKKYRAREAVKYLFRHVKNWKRLFELAKKEGLVDKVHDLYKEARRTIKCRKIPKRYMK